MFNAHLGKGLCTTLYYLFKSAPVSLIFWFSQLIMNKLKFKSILTWTRHGLINHKIERQQPKTLLLLILKT